MLTVIVGIVYARMPCHAPPVWGRDHQRDVRSRREDGGCLTAAPHLRGRVRLHDRRLERA